MANQINVIQAGYPKSGNYWLYRNIKELLLADGVKLKSFVARQPIFPLAKSWPLSYPEQVEINMLDIFYESAFWRISSVFREQITDFEEYADSNSIAWTHSDYYKNTAKIFSHFKKRVYLIRDPRDIAISTARFAFTPYMKQYYPTYHQNSYDYLRFEYENIIRSWMQHVVGYLKYALQGDMQIIFYERMTTGYYHEVKKLADYLGIETDQEILNQLQQKTSARQMKKSSPDHVRKARHYGWQEILDDEQVQDAFRIAAPLLELLNYPLSRTDENIPEIKITGSRLAAVGI